MKILNTYLKSDFIETNDVNEVFKYIFMTFPDTLGPQMARLKPAIDMLAPHASQECLKQICTTMHGTCYQPLAEKYLHPHIKAALTVKTACV